MHTASHAYLALGTNDAVANDKMLCFSAAWSYLWLTHQVPFLLLLRGLDLCLSLPLPLLMLCSSR